MNINQMITDILFSSGRTAMTVLRGLILIPVITNLIGVGEYGIWVTILAIVTIISSIGGLHLKGALIRYMPSENIDGQTFIDILVISLVAALGCSLFVLLVDLSMSIIPLEGRTPASSAIVSCLIGTYIVYDTAINYPRALGNVKEYEIIQSSQILIEAVLLTVVLWMTRSLLYGFGILLITSTTFTIFVIIYYFPTQVPRPNLDKFPMYFRYSLPMVPKAIGTRLITHADKYLILYFLSPTAVGIYAVAYTVAAFFENLATILSPTLFPNVVRAWDEGDTQSLHDLYEGVFRWYSIISFPALFGIVLLSEEIIQILSTASVARDGRVLLSLLVFGFLIRGYESPLSYVLHAAEKNGWIAKIIIVAAVLNILLNVILIPVFGLYGAVAATLLSQLVIAVFISYLARSLLPFPVPIVSIMRSIISSTIMAIVLLVFPFELVWWITIFVYFVCGIIVYTICLLLLGELEQSDFFRIVESIKSI